MRRLQDERRVQEGDGCDGNVEQRVARSYAWEMLCHEQQVGYCRIRDVAFQAAVSPRVDRAHPSSPSGTLAQALQRRLRAETWEHSHLLITEEAILFCGQTLAMIKRLLHLHPNENRVSVNATGTVARARSRVFIGAQFRFRLDDA